VFGPGALAKIHRYEFTSVPQLPQAILHVPSNILTPRESIKSAVGGPGQIQALRGAPSVAREWFGFG